MTYIPEFSEPQSYWPRAHPPLALGQSGERGARRELPLGETPRSRRNREGPHPRFRNPSIHLRLRQAGDENGDPPVRNRSARCGIPNPTCRSLIGWGSRINPAPPRDDRIPSPDQKYLHTSTTPTNWGRKRYPPGRNRPARCGNPSALADR